MLLFIEYELVIGNHMKYRFNTSHVVIYQSKHKHIAGEAMFQYISCCYLSFPYNNYYTTYLCFNTSHVVIYPYWKEHCKNRADSFNTSHVVIYLISTLQLINQSLFQYISCCYLSGGRHV